MTQGIGNGYGNYNFNFSTNGPSGSEKKSAQGNTANTMMNDDELRALAMSNANIDTLIINNSSVFDLNNDGDITEEEINQYRELDYKNSLESIKQESTYFQGIDPDTSYENNDVNTKTYESLNEGVTVLSMEDQKEYFAKIGINFETSGYNFESTDKPYASRTLDNGNAEYVKVVKDKDNQLKIIQTIVEPGKSVGTTMVYDGIKAESNSNTISKNQTKQEVTNNFAELAKTHSPEERAKILKNLENLFSNLSSEEVLKLVGDELDILGLNNETIINTYAEAVNNTTGDAKETAIANLNYSLSQNEIEMLETSRLTYKSESTLDDTTKNQMYDWFIEISQTVDTGDRTALVEKVNQYMDDNNFSPQERILALEQIGNSVGQAQSTYIMNEYAKVGIGDQSSVTINPASLQETNNYINQTVSPEFDQEREIYKTALSELET